MWRVMANAEAEPWRNRVETNSEFECDFSATVLGRNLCSFHAVHNGYDGDAARRAPHRPRAGVDSRTAPSVHPRAFLPYGRPHNREGLGFHVSVQQILILDDGSVDCALRFPT